MERRTFMALVSGGLLAVPLAAEAILEQRSRPGDLDQTRRIQLGNRTGGAPWPGFLSYETTTR